MPPKDIFLAEKEVYPEDLQWPLEYFPSKLVLDNESPTCLHQSKEILKVFANVSLPKKENENVYW